MYILCCPMIWGQEGIVCFVDIGVLADHHCLNCFIKTALKWNTGTSESD